uniref:Uncharacterized protein n=1 Tax=Oryza brachyantha TaxID=4533 RepID=J3LN68_ORYBR
MDIIISSVANPRRCRHCCRRHRQAHHAAVAEHVPPSPSSCSSDRSRSDCLSPRCSRCAAVVR